MANHLHTLEVFLKKTDCFGFESCEYAFTSAIEADNASIFKYLLSKNKLFNCEKYLKATYWSCMWNDEINQKMKNRAIIGFLKQRLSLDTQQ